MVPVNFKGQFKSGDVVKIHLPKIEEFLHVIFTKPSYFVVVGHPKTYEYFDGIKGPYSGLSINIALLDNLGLCEALYDLRRKHEHQTV